jgi:hypothetical protein
VPKTTRDYNKLLLFTISVRNREVPAMTTEELDLDGATDKATGRNVRV